MSKHGWTYKKLGEVCESKNNIIRAKSNFNPSDEIQYIDISSIDNRLFKIVNCTPYIFSNAPSRAQQVVRTGDIIISLVRPNLKNIAFVNDDSNNLVASSGFCVLRSKTINKGYLFHLIKSDTFTNYLLTRVSGANYPAVREDDIREYKIPVPPMAEQEAIVAELDEINEAIAALQQQVADLDTLAQATFYDMFGDPVTNPKSWELKKLKELSDKISNGNTPKGGSQVYVEEGILFLRSQNVWKNRLELDDVAYLDDETHAKMSDSSLKHNDILITKTGRVNTENSSLGRAALFTGEDDSANINGHVYLVRLKDGVLHKFILYILISESFRELIRRVCVGGIDKRQLNKNHIEDFPIIYPPLAMQQEFVEKFEAIEAAKAELNAQIAEMQTLLASRMDYYFD